LEEGCIFAPIAKDCHHGDVTLSCPCGLVDLLDVVFIDYGMRRNLEGQ